MKKALILVLTLLVGLLVPSFTAQAVQIDSLTEASQNINAYYEDLFASMGQEYHAPHVHLVQEDENYYSACFDGMPVPAGFLAFYCPIDETIVLEQVEMDKLDAIDTFIPMFIMAHEWGHHIEILSGWNVPEGNVDAGDWNVAYSIEWENAADCFAGAWTGYLKGTYQANDSDLTNVIVIMVQEYGGSGGLQPGAHGTEAQRVGATLRGYEYGLPGCMTLRSTEGTSISPV